MRRLWLAWLVLLALGVSYSAEAQLSRRQIKKNNKRIGSFRGQKSSFSEVNGYNSIGLSVNGLDYYGDLAPKPSRFSTDLAFTKPAFGLSFQRRMGPRLSVRAEYMWGILKGSDAESADPEDENAIYRYKRNLSFRNYINDLSVVGMMELFRNEGNYLTRHSWSPYAYLGVTLLRHSPEAIAPATDLNGAALPQAGQWVKLRDLGTEGQYASLLPTDANYGIKPYSLFQVAIPFGFGARIKINEAMDLFADIGFRYSFTDYLDDVSQNYVDLGVFNNELARAMSYRTGELNLNSSSETSYVARNGVTYTVENGYGSEFPTNIRGSKNDNDVYMVTSIRLAYILGATIHKAKFR